MTTEIGGNAGLLVDGVFQCFTSFEARVLGGFDLDGGTGLRVTALTGSALAHRERTEADEGHGVAFFQGFGDYFDDGIDGASGGGFGQVGLFGYGSNKVSFIHFDKSPKCDYSRKCRN